VRQASIQVYGPLIHGYFVGVLLLGVLPATLYKVLRPLRCSSWLPW